MNNQETQKLIPCPGCSGAKVRGMALCHNCKKQYVTESADIALAGNPVSIYENWIEKRVRDRIPTLQTDLKTAQKNFATTQRKAEEKLRQLLLERISGQKLTPEVLVVAKAKLKEKEEANIWKAIGGAGVYRESKIASSRLLEAWRLLKDLEVKKTKAVEDKAKAQNPEPKPEPEIPAETVLPVTKDIKKKKRITTPKNSDEKKSSKPVKRTKGSRASEKAKLLQTVNKLS